MNPKHYTFLKADLATTQSLREEYEQTIPAKRREALDNLIAKYNAMEVALRSRWGRPDGVMGLIYPVGDPALSQSHIRILDDFTIDGQDCKIVTGKRNSKAGKSLCHNLEHADSLLTELPKFQDWLPIRLDAVRGYIGGPHPGGRGFSMLETTAGMSQAKDDDDAVVVMAVPVYHDGEEKPFSAPDGFTTITYGQFYDITTPPKTESA